MKALKKAVIGFLLLLVISAVLNSFLNSILPNIIIYLQILGGSVAK